MTLRHSDIKIFSSCPIALTFSFNNATNLLSTLNSIYLSQLHKIIQIHLIYAHSSAVQFKIRNNNQSNMIFMTMLASYTQCESRKLIRIIMHHAFHCVYRCSFPYAQCNIIDSYPLQHYIVREVKIKTGGDNLYELLIKICMIATCNLPSTGLI